MNLLLIIVSHFFFGETLAGPLLTEHRPDLFPTTLDKPVFDLPACPNHRSIWKIVWGCFVTIFACSWIAIHPDVPSPDETRLVIIARRLEYMVWTILAPELVISWAGRQWIGVRNCTERFSYKEMREVFEEHQWTPTHFHFLQMGGFTVFDGNRSLGTLCQNHLRIFLLRKRIKFPEITIEEIEDFSKNDVLSKIITMGQTPWFIVHVSTRRALGLAVTELEIATVAFAVLSAVMYFFWWDKPFDVRSFVPLYLLDEGEKLIVSREKGRF